MIGAIWILHETIMCLSARYRLYENGTMEYPNCSTYVWLLQDTFFF